MDKRNDDDWFDWVGEVDRRYPGCDGVCVFIRVITLLLILALWVATFYFVFPWLKN